MERRATKFTLIGLFVLCVALHLPFVTWGEPAGTTAERTYPLAADDLGPLGALAEMHNTFFGSKPDRNYAYPWFHYALTAGAQAPYLVWAKFDGSWSRPEAAYPFGFTHPERALRALSIAARLLNVVLAALTVLCAYGFAATLFGPRAGLPTALLVLANDAFQYYGRTGNLDGPMTFWCALGLFIAARVLRHGVTRRRMIVLGCTAALAMATKDQAVVQFLPIALALLFARIAPLDDREARSRTQVILFGLATSIVLYLAATGMFVDPARHVEHVRKTLFEPHSLSVMHFYYQPLTSWSDLLANFVHALARVTTWPVLAMACLGLALLAKSSPRHLVLWLPVPATFVLLSVPTGLTPYRYLLPLLVLVDALAVYALVRGTRGRPRSATFLLVLLLLPRVLFTADLDYAQWTETRERAAAWLVTHARTGDRVEFFGAPEKLPPLPAAIATERIAGRATGWQGEFDIEEKVHRHLLSERAPAFVILIPDWTSRPGMRRSQDCPAAIERALEECSLPYEQVARFEACTLLPRWFARPRLDNPSVSPPVRIFARIRSTK